MTTNEQTVGRYLRWVLAALALGAGVIHFAVSSEHYSLSWLHGSHDVRFGGSLARHMTGGIGNEPGQALLGTFTFCGSGASCPDATLPKTNAKTIVSRIFMSTPSRAVRAISCPGQCIGPELYAHGLP